jgi:hypothetical protein
MVTVCSSIFLRTDHHPVPIEQGIMIPIIIAIRTGLTMVLTLSITILPKSGSLITVRFYLVKQIFIRVETESPRLKVENPAGSKYVSVKMNRAAPKRDMCPGAGEPAMERHIKNP